ncbi:hypothetical protein EKO29_09665 [Colwellia sp. Arc7-635]|uniref:DUF6988 family protein n=1 Tax=Colwellia sp. Arc7-635 TaxID=2497879 RepID=UPI000F85A08A|nr:hypothetical protein [Colwellia sp. Arc7-635]AZQ84263.1 hypothetical protein EKO29_09665 [Colwellia sp. Arc7-635]
MDELLEKSEALSSEFSRIFEYGPADESKRVIASWLMCSVALEHSVSLRQLVLHGNYTTAIGVMRLQFEAAARATWLHYAASDTAIDKMTRILSADNANADNSLPMVSEMIKKLGKKAPKQAVAMLTEFKDISYKALSSYIHGGIHALQRHGSGYPEELLENVIKSSNGLLTMTAMMAAILTGNKVIAKDISSIQRRHEDCLPQLLVKA